MKKRRLSQKGKIIIALLTFIVLFAAAGLFYSSSLKNKASEGMPAVSSAAVSSSDSAVMNENMADKYNRIWEEYSALNEDYIAYLEWENDLLYGYGEDTTDPYPHVIVRSRIVDDRQGDVNIANAEYMRNDITHTERSFGQDFIDAGVAVDENYVPQDQNIILYGHYVYPKKYGLDFLKFTPLHKFKEMEDITDYDTFTLTFNGEQREYRVVHAFIYNSNLFADRQDSPLALNYTDEELARHIERIEGEYGDFIESDMEIEAGDHFVTLQTCVENREDQLFFVVAKQTKVTKF